MIKTVSVIVKKEWGKLLGKFGCILDLGMSYVFEKQFVETFLHDPTEYLDIDIERANEILVSMRANKKHWVEMNHA